MRIKDPGEGSEVIAIGKGLLRFGWVEDRFEHKFEVFESFRIGFRGNLYMKFTTARAELKQAGVYR